MVLTYYGHVTGRLDQTKKSFSTVLPVRTSELLHQIEQAGEHSWAIAPTFALLQAGIPNTASPPPLTPPSHAPYLTKGQAAPSPARTLFATTVCLRRWRRKMRGGNSHKGV